MNNIPGYATIAIDGKASSFPSPAAKAALPRLVDQSVTQTQSVGSERIELYFSNGAVLSFVFDPVAEWMPVWDGEPLNSNVVSLHNASRISSRRHLI